MKQLTELKKFGWAVIVGTVAESGTVATESVCRRRKECVTNSVV